MPPAIHLRYGGRDWSIVIVKSDDRGAFIELRSTLDTDTMVYGTVTLDTDPQSCAFTVHRANLPYTILRALVQVVEAEIRRLGIRFELEMR